MLLLLRLEISIIGQWNFIYILGPNIQPNSGFVLIDRILYTMVLG